MITYIGQAKSTGIFLLAKSQEEYLHRKRRNDFSGIVFPFSCLCLPPSFTYAVKVALYVQFLGNLQQLQPLLHTELEMNYPQVGCSATYSFPGKKLCVLGLERILLLKFNMEVIKRTKPNKLI